jgi:ligand-binding sensor domain-containing protein
MIRTLLHAILAGLALAAQAAPGTGAIGQAELVYVDSYRNFGIEEGLPQVSVNALLQGRDGYLWIGTFGGLARFDGVSFKAFHASAGGLPSNRILSLYEDRRGRLWIGTQEGGIALYESGRFRSLDVCGGTCQISVIRPSADGRKLWALGPQGVFEFDPETLQSRVRHPVFNAFDFVAPMPDGNVYVAGGDGLARIGADSLTDMALPAGSTWVTMMEGRGRYLWMITDDWRLYRYDVIDRSWRMVRAGISPNTRLIISNDGRLLVSDWLAGGIGFLHDDGSTTPLAGIPAGLYAKRAYVDREGNLWIGTDTLGLWRIRASRIGLMQSADVRMNAPGRAVVEDGEGGFWFGIACGGLRHWNRNGEVRVVQLESTLGTECVQSLLMDDQRRLWIGTWQGTLGRLENGRLSLARKWPQGGALNVWRNPDDDTYWISTLRDTWRLDVGTQGEVVDAQAVPALDGMAISFMTPARNGGTWFVGDQGAYRLVDGRIVERWRQQVIGTRFLRWLYEDPDGATLWIGSYGGGLIRIRDGSVRRYDTASGLFDDTVSCILPDADGRLWLGGNRGVSVLADRNFGRRGPELIVLSTSDGLIPPEMNGGTVSSCLRDSRGRLWFALIKGFAMIDPARFNTRAGPPIVHIESLRVAGRDFDPVRPVQLGPKAGNLEIGYTAIGLASPERLRFRYRLVSAGSDSDWLDAGDRRNVLLPTLPWGKLAFEVEARQLGSAWSEPVSLRLEHPLPWYRRQWIWLVISLACLLALLWATRDRGPAQDYEHLLEDIRASRRGRKAVP